MDIFTRRSNTTVRNGGFAGRNGSAKRRDSNPKKCRGDKALTVVAEPEVLELTEEEWDEYLSVALANYQRVTPGEKKKLKGLMAYYAKKAHPFTSCVNDNTKRFGKERAERICAVLKDLIKGTTKWRGEEKKAHLSESTMKELFEVKVEDSFYHYIEELSEEDIENMTKVNLSDDREVVLAELFFGADEAVEEDGLLYKTIFREGTWKYSPGPGQKPVEKPLTVVKEGASSRADLVISMTELKENFEKGAKDSVTVPLNHDNRPHENTGYIKKLKFDVDSEGRTVLKGGFDFTEPDVKNKAQNGSIPGTSGGVVFDYIHKEKGDKYGAVLDHVALTPNPWLNGMEPFGMADEENLQIIAFSEELESTGGETEVGEIKDKPEEKAEPTLAEKLGLSEDEITARMKEYEDLKKENRDRAIKEKITAWQNEGKNPAVLTEAEKILTADDGAVALHLSENGSDKGLTLSDVVDLLVNAQPTVKLSEDQVKDKDQSKDKPADSTEDENNEAKLSQEEKIEVTSLMFDEKVVESEAIKRVLAKRESK